jgi:hypothetical protein
MYVLLAWIESREGGIALNIWEVSPSSGCDLTCFFLDLAAHQWKILRKYIHFCPCMTRLPLLEITLLELVQEAMSVRCWGRKAERWGVGKGGCVWER